MSRKAGTESSRVKHAFIHAASLAAAILAFNVNTHAEIPQAAIAKTELSLATTTSAPVGAPQVKKRRIVISLADRKLALMEDGRVVKIYRVAVGTRLTPTPSGEFKIINRVKNPTWYGGKIQPGVVIPAGPQNPLGNRWIGLNEKGYGIHGTNAPKSIGKRASHGCVRMSKADLEEIFEIVRVGDTVELIGVRTVELAQIFGAAQTAPAQPAQTIAAPVVASVMPS
ncbi:MAG: L,D-transpeptidase [Acidobacteria bacterium]|nr:L,D-transpeptidase [Acidobacteriota bacterium]